MILVGQPMVPMPEPSALPPTLVDQRQMHPHLHHRSPSYTGEAQQYGIAVPPPPEPLRQTQTSINPPLAASSSAAYHGYQFNQDQQEQQQQLYQRIVRKKTVKRLELFRGNLVINCPVPDKLIQNVPYKNVEEVATMVIAIYFLCTASLNGFIVV
jgi:hypothetical protein